MSCSSQIRRWLLMVWSEQLPIRFPGLLSRSYHIHGNAARRLPHLQCPVNVETDQLGQGRLSSLDMIPPHLPLRRFVGQPELGQGESVFAFEEYYLHSFADSHVLFFLGVHFAI